jgi:hypothetical protein
VTAGAGEDRGEARDGGFRRRKRQDHALALIEELEEAFDNLPRVRRLLLELGRFYDPVLGGAIVTIPQQQAVMRALESGQIEEARRIVRERYDLYIRDRAHLGRGDQAGPSRDWELP